MASVLRRHHSLFALFAQICKWFVFLNKCKIKAIFLNNSFTYFAPGDLFDFLSLSRTSLRNLYASISLISDWLGNVSQSLLGGGADRIQKRSDAQISSVQRLKISTIEVVTSQPPPLPLEIFLVTLGTYKTLREIPI